MNTRRVLIIVGGRREHRNSNPKSHRCVCMCSVALSSVYKQNWIEKTLLAFHFPTAMTEYKEEEDN